MNDQDLIEQIRQGNPDKAVSRLYSNLGTFRKFVKGSGGAREEADDIFQEALLVFLRKVSHEQFVLSAAVNTYLLAICKYMWMDTRRKKGKHFQLGLENLEELAAEVAEETETIQSLQQAVTALNDIGARCLELLENFYFRKMSMKEIATHMKFSSEKVAKGQKYKCLEKARKKVA